MTTTPFTWNWTDAIVPAASVAVAVSCTGAPAVTDAPLEGAVSVTTGAGAAATVRATGEDVVDAPALFVATAVTE